MPIVEGLEGGEDLEVRVLYVEESTTRRPERITSKINSKMCPTFCPTATRYGSVRLITRGGQSRSKRHAEHPAGWVDQTFTIFEGTSEIQRLIISRAISGVHIK